VTGDLFFDEHLFSDNSTNIDEHMKLGWSFKLRRSFVATGIVGRIESSPAWGLGW